MFIGIPQGAIPKGTSGVLTVTPVTEGDFIFPPQCQLVSSIFHVSCSLVLQKRVSLYIDHAAIIESESECSNFKVIAAKCSEGPPYQFKVLQHGHFTQDSSYARIDVKQFSFFGCIRRGHTRKVKYRAYVLYRQIQPSCWSMIFSLVKAIRMSEKVYYNNIYSAKTILDYRYWRRYIQDIQPTSQFQLL